jgi:hypothetical protein
MMKFTMTLAALAAATLVACGGGGSDVSEPTAIERLDAIDAQMASGVLTREAAAQARLAVVADVQEKDPTAVRIVQVQRKAADGKMQPEMSWFTAVMIVTRALTLSGDTCDCFASGGGGDFSGGHGASGSW